MCSSLKRRLQRKVAREALEKAQVPMSYFNFPISTASNCTYSLATLQPCDPYPVGCSSAPNKCAQKEREDAMPEYNMEVDQRNHLKRRLDTAKNKQLETLHTTYHMETIRPKNKDEILAAFKNSTLVLNEDYFKADGTLETWTNWQSAVSLADPARDEAGYKTAKAALDTAFTTAKDTVIVMPLADGLAALQKFEAATF